MEDEEFELGFGMEAVMLKWRRGKVGNDDDGGCYSHAKRHLAAADRSPYVHVRIETKVRGEGERERQELDRLLSWRITRIGSWKKGYRQTKRRNV